MALPRTWRNRTCAASYLGRLGAILHGYRSVGRETTLLKLSYEVMSHVNGHDILPLHVLRLSDKALRAQMQRHPQPPGPSTRTPKRRAQRSHLRPLAVRAYGAGYIRSLMGEAAVAAATTTAATTTAATIVAARPESAISLPRFVLLGRCLMPAESPRTRQAPNEIIRTGPGPVRGCIAAVLFW